MNIYISGPITGLPGLNVKAFADVDKKIKALGHYAVNPHVICGHLPTDSHWSAYMRVCIKALCDCDAIIFLPGWWKSKGALLERMVAFAILCKVFYADSFGIGGLK